MPKKPFGPPIQDVKTEILEDDGAEHEARSYGPSGGQVVMTEELDETALEVVDGAEQDGEALGAEALGAESMGVETQLSPAPTLRELHADFEDSRAPAGGPRAFAPPGATLTTKVDQERSGRDAQEVCGYTIAPHASLLGADLAGANLVKAKLHGADLRSAQLAEANLYRADLESADLRAADLSRVQLVRANCQKADMREVILEGASLQDANLTKTDLRGACLDRAYLDDARLRGARLEGASLVEAEVSDATFNGAIYDDETVFPEGFDPRKRGLRKAQ